MKQIVRILLVSGFFCGIVWFLCLATPAPAQQIASSSSRSKYTVTSRPIRLSRQHPKVVIEVKEMGVSQQSEHTPIPSVVVSAYEVNGRTRQKLYSLNLGKDLYFSVDASLCRHRSSGHYLLAIEGNMGRYGHTQVYYIDPKTVRLRPLFRDIGVIWATQANCHEGG
jgi:hypothetical protein